MPDAIREMVGKTFVKVERRDDEEILFHLEDGSLFKMYHEQDCCESVWIEDLNGNLEDLVNTPILVAEERDSELEIEADRLMGIEPSQSGGESETWTFYTIRTIKGSVDIRWYGTSNGYYSESAHVTFFPASETEDLHV